MPFPSARTRRVPVRAARRPRAAPLLALTGAALLVLLGGCTQVHAALALQSDDTVAGDVAFGVVGGPPPQVELPGSLTRAVAVTPYRDGDYQGVRLRFDALRFDQLNALVDTVPAARGRIRLELRRTGGLVGLTGQADLSALPVDRADVQLKLAYPGTLVNTDGRDESGTVSWTFTPGQVNRFSAVINSPDPGAPSVAWWSLLVAALVAAAVIAVVLLAKAHRNPPVRGRRPGP